MTTADVVRERALALARSGTDPNQAVRELEISCEGRRVAAVRARQQLLAVLDIEPDQQDAIVAIEFLDGLLARLPGWVGGCEERTYPRIWRDCGPTR
jgi:hypothetical protein